MSDAIFSPSIVHHTFDSAKMDVLARCTYCGKSSAELWAESAEKRRLIRCTVEGVEAVRKAYERHGVPFYEYPESVEVGS